MWFVLLYIGFGVALAAGTMAFPVLRKRMEIVASRLDMKLSYARALWVTGTIIAWPVGLYVLSTGRLVLPTKVHASVSDLSAVKSTQPMPSPMPSDDSGPYQDDVKLTSEVDPRSMEVQI